MNQLVITIIALLSGLNLPDHKAPVARYHQFVAQAEMALFEAHDARKAIILYDSAFAHHAGFRYDFLNASYAAMQDKHYRKFEEYVSRGNAVGLNRNTVRYALHTENPVLWKSFKKHVKNIRVGYYGFFRYKTLAKSESYKKAEQKSDHIFRRDRRVHKSRCMEKLFAKGVDRRNKTKFVKLVNTYGFPDILKTGDTYPCKDCAFRHEFVMGSMARQADFPKVFEELWPELKYSLEAGGLYPRTIPFIIDQYLFYQGAPQLFGTLHVHKQNADKSWTEYRHEVQDVTLANEWRAKFYMRPLELDIKMSGVGFAK